MLKGKHGGTKPQKSRALLKCKVSVSSEISRPCMSAAQPANKPNLKSIKSIMLGSRSGATKRRSFPYPGGVPLLPLHFPSSLHYLFLHQHFLKYKESSTQNSTRYFVDKSTVFISLSHTYIRHIVQGLTKHTTAAFQCKLKIDIQGVFVDFFLPYKC